MRARGHHAVYYTSGTTGAPKGCMLHHGWWLRVVDIDLRLNRRGWRPPLCCLPFYYADPAIYADVRAADRRHAGRDAPLQRVALLGRGARLRRDRDPRRSPRSRRCCSRASRAPTERDHRVRLATCAAVPTEHARGSWSTASASRGSTTTAAPRAAMMCRVPLQCADELVGTGSMGVAPPGGRPPDRRRRRPRCADRRSRARS